MTRVNPLSPHNYVSLILDNKILIKNVTNDGSSVIRSLEGYKEEIAGEKVWILEFKDELQEADLLSDLNEIGFLFVGGTAGWPPAEIFAYLREKGLVSGRFTEVTWLGSGKWTTRIR